MIQSWLQFLALGAVIAVAGYWLSRFGDVISERTGLSGSWIGLALIASVTSLPELVTGVASVTIEDAPNLAVGDAIGSCLFNLLLVAFIDVIYRPASIFSRTSQGHALSAGYGAILLGMVGLSVLSPVVFPGWHIGPGAILIVAVYALALRSTFTYERRRLMELAEPAAVHSAGVSARQAVLGYMASAAAVVAAGILLPGAALDLAGAMGWTDVFVGTLFIPVITSLPELVVTISAVRMRALDMALAGLLGSNLFNVLVIAIDDVAYTKGPLLPLASDAHVISLMSAMIMNGLVIVSLIYRSGRRPGAALTWPSVGLAAIYVANTMLLWNAA